MQSNIIDTPYYRAIFNPAIQPDINIVNSCFAPRACSTNNNAVYAILVDGSTVPINSSNINAANFNWSALGKIVLAVVISAATALLSDIIKEYLGDIKVDVGEDTLININFDKFKEEVENCTKNK